MNSENSEHSKPVPLDYALGVKVYCMNWDGKSERMVAAKTKKAAIAALGTTPYQFNQYAAETGNVHDLHTALSDIGAVYQRSYKRGSKWERISP